MSTISSIEWTDRTWGVVLGCHKRSPGCQNCYAIRTAYRLSHNPNPKIGPLYAGLTQKTAGGNLNWTGLVRTVPERLEDPLHWKKPQRIFVDSQADLFDESVPFEFLHDIWRVMHLAHWHRFIILTKEPARMLEFLNWYRNLPGSIKAHHIGYERAFACIWLGVSVENQAEADKRIPLLLQAPAAVRFLSCEPLLGPVDLSSGLGIAPPALPYFASGTPLCSDRMCRREGSHYPAEWGCRWSKVHVIGGPVPNIDWVIAGGESGPGARPMLPDWPRQIRDQCVEARVPYFFKQWGEHYTISYKMTTGEPVFRQFDSHQHWVDKASTWINGGVCVDTAGNVLTCGGDFAKARDEGRFPVTIMHRVGKKKAGRELDGRTWDEMPQLEAVVL